MCVSHPAAEALRGLQGIKYVTISPVLPTLHALWETLERDDVRQHCNNTRETVARIRHNVKKHIRNYYHTSDAVC